MPKPEEFSVRSPHKAVGSVAKHSVSLNNPKDQQVCLGNHSLHPVELASLDKPKLSRKHQISAVDSKQTHHNLLKELKVSLDSPRPLKVLASD